MITLAWYLLKVTICSGILATYYYLALRNKIFHRWNRFYLLAAIVLALGVPLMKINILQKPGTETGTVIRMLQTITASDEIIVEYSRNSGLQLSLEKMIAVIYLAVSIVFLSLFIMGIYKISRLKRLYPETRMNGISFISTDARGTPFSFLNSIFWNNAIDLHTQQGHQIFNHEIAHIKEKHTYDKIFMNVVILFFWINPFFWLIRKELGMIHEFIADKEALEDNDINAFAEMVLQTVYPGQQFSITNNFFHSPLKRRLTMFTKNKNPKVSYVSRLLVLPLAALVFLAFTLKMKTTGSASHYAGKMITVIIDAGHGGSDNGIIENDIKEKDLNLSVAKEIRELNKNENIHIILSRDGDMTLTPQDRIKFARENKADLFVSIHTDAEAIEDKNKHSGLTIFIPKDDNAYVKQSKLLGSAIIASFKNKYQLQVNDFLMQRKEGIWVLKANQFPSVLIETGFITTQTDFDYITKPGTGQTIAENILKGIEEYAGQNLLRMDIDDAKAITSDNIQSINVLKNENATNKYGEKIKDGAFEITRKNANAQAGIAIRNTTDPLANPAYFIDGKEVSKDGMTHLSPNSILAINVLKGENAIKKYGDKGRDGVIEITTGTQTDSIPGKVFTKVENEAEFPGGREAWSQYIMSQIKKNQDKFTNKDYGTCLVKFIVNTDGSVTNVEDSTMKNTQLAKVAVEAIRSGPKWIPATQNNQVVAAYRLQPITLTQPK
ncbi:MAG: N-acetylmuramoyl-L-alanine amidase [Ginsengibacter sp.]